MSLIIKYTLLFVRFDIKYQWNNLLRWILFYLLKDFTIFAKMAVNDVIFELTLNGRTNKDISALSDSTFEINELIYFHGYWWNEVVNNLLKKVAMLFASAWFSEKHVEFISMWLSFSLFIILIPIKNWYLGGTWPIKYYCTYWVDTN